MFTLNCNGRLLAIAHPLIMGIINATPDSFYSGSRFAGTDAVLAQCEKMLGEGATIIDIGGQSTRPGSTRVSAEEELRRIAGPVEAIHRHFPEAFISIDTYHARVAGEAVAAGASLVNDISAGSMDSGLIPTVASMGVPYILMHMQGTPDTMHHDPHYENITRDVLDFFIAKTGELRQAGIRDIIIDPGFGFGKTIAHNFELLRNLAALQLLRLPVLAGLSRKSTIYKTLQVTADETLNGTTVLNTIALMNGAAILRVHDVKEAKEAIRLTEACKGAL
ncbi:MAG: dihydropteroate synthase [Chitinophagaceae bacterium]